MTSSGRGRDSATPECFGRVSQVTIFVRSSKLSLFFPESCSFRRLFFCCFPRFCKIWCQKFEPWGFWFQRCLGALFENCAPSLGTLPGATPTPMDHFVHLDKPAVFPSRTALPCCGMLYRLRCVKRHLLQPSSSDALSYFNKVQDTNNSGHCAEIYLRLVSSTLNPENCANCAFLWILIIGSAEALPTLCVKYAR